MKEINDSGGKAIGISTDSTSVESLNSAFETISKELPDHKLAAAVYNVAAWVPPKPFTEATLEELNGSINANMCVECPRYVTAFK